MRSISPPSPCKEEEEVEKEDERDRLGPRLFFLVGLGKGEDKSMGLSSRTIACGAGKGS